MISVSTIKATVEKPAEKAMVAVSSFENVSCVRSSTEERHSLSICVKLFVVQRSKSPSILRR